MNSLISLRRATKNDLKFLEKQLEQKNLDLLNKNKRVRELKIFIDSLEKQDELLTFA